MRTPANVKACLALAGMAMLTVTRTARALGPVDVEMAGEVGTGTNPVGGNVYVEPGACLLLTFGHAMFGADANLLVLPGFGSATSWNATDTALNVHLQAGVRF